MFYIDQSSAAFLHAKEEHYVNLRHVIKKRLLGNHFQEDHPKIPNRTIRKIPMEIPHEISEYLCDEENLRNILIGTPDILDQRKNMFNNPGLKDVISSLFKYKAFIKKNAESTFGFYNAYDLANNLGINTCVYCNRLYTHTVVTANGEKIMRPTFDHWYPKERFPILSLSFYNLIPSCSICNTSVKGTQAYLLDQHFHPYLKHNNGALSLDIKFSYKMIGVTQAECKIVSNNDFSEYSVSQMRLKEMYSCHGEEINELIFLKKAYGNSYIQSLSSILNIKLSPEEVYRLAFGTYSNELDFVKRPLSKLKKDILTELGII